MDRSAGGVPSVVTRHGWLMATCEGEWSQRRQAAAFLLASPILWRKLGPQPAPGEPWRLHHPQEGAWSTSERCLQAWVLALADPYTERMADELLDGLASLDTGNAGWVRVALAVATGRPWRGSVLDLPPDWGA